MSKGYKSYLAVMTFVVVIAGGYFAYKYARVYFDLDRELDHAFDQQGLPATTSEVAPGTYVIYSTTEDVNRGSKEDTSDDTLKTSYYRVSLDNPDETMLLTSQGYSLHGIEGGPTLTVIGDRLLYTTYSVGPASWLSLDGQMEKTALPSKQVLVSPNGAYRAQWKVDWDNHSGKVNLQVYPTSPKADAPLVDAFLDPADLGIDWGYPEPVAIADDGTVYLNINCGCDGRPVGFWKFEIGKGISEVSYMREQKLTEFTINGVTKQLIAIQTSANGPVMEIGGNAPSGPTKIYLVDLATNTGRIILEDDALLQGVRLSSDSTMWTYSSEDGVVRVLRIGATPTNADMKVSGTVKDWIGETLIVDRDGELILYHLNDNTVTSIARSVGGWWGWVDPDKVMVQYVGTITIND